MARRSSSHNPGSHAASPRPPLDQLRGAVYRRDGRGVVAILAQHGPALCLQWAGQGLLLALAEGIDGAFPPTQQTARALRTRGLRGDEVLAEELDAATGDGPIPLRAAVTVDLGELAAVMDLDPDMGEHFLHRGTGELRMRGDSMVTGESDDDGWLDDDDWIRVEPRESSDAWDDMAEFAAAIEDRAFGARLARAIEGRGAFRRFKDLLAEEPAVRDRWFAWSEDRELARARAFLADHGLRPSYAADAGT